MAESQKRFQAPTSFERLMNSMIGFVVGLGFGMRYNRLLIVRGRKSGRLFSTPVNVVTRGNRQFLVAPRGYTQWVRNASAAGEVRLKRGFNSRMYRVDPVPDARKPEILKAYLDEFQSQVKKFFPIPAGSPEESFQEIAKDYPVFELIAMG